MAALPVGGWGAAGATGPTGPAGPAPSGTGLVSVTDGVLDTPSTLAARLAADAAALAAAQAYADAIAANLDPKQSVFAAEAPAAEGGVNVASLSGTQTVGAVSVGAGKRVLLSAQTDPVENGFWLTAAGAWARPSDSVTGKLSTGAHTFCETGTNAGTEFLLTTADPVTVGVTAQTWVIYRKMQLSAATPQPLGSAAAGSSGQASDAGHVHAMPSASDVGAVPTTRTVAGAALSGDVSAATIAAALGLGAVTATGANAAAARAAISAAESVTQPAYDFTSSTGLTPFLGNAGNTVTVNGGVAAIYSPAAAGQLRFGNPLTGPALYRNFPGPVAEFDVATRVLPFTGTSSPNYNCRPGIEVSTLGAFANPALPRQRFTFNTNTGTMNWENEAGMQTESLGGTVPLNGTGWLRVQLIGTTMTFWSGIGVGAALPTTWTMRKRWVPTAALYESVCVSLQLGGSQTPVTANFGALAVLLPASL